MFVCKMFLSKETYSSGTFISTLLRKRFRKGCERKYLYYSNIIMHWGMFIHWQLLYSNLVQLQYETLNLTKFF